MAATLMTDEECVLTNVPQITDVVVMGNLLRDLGARVEGLGSKVLRICCADAPQYAPGSGTCQEDARGGDAHRPLVARRGHVRTSHPGAA